MRSLSLIIIHYNQPEYLARVLNAVASQPSKPAEVLLADDGSAEETRLVFSSWAPRQQMRTEHVRQSHDGFRKARILNQAIARAQGDYLVFLDGDIVPHPKFIADHLRLSQSGA